MLRAEAARLGEAGLQRAACAMHAHGRVAGGQIAFRGVGLQGRAADLDVLQRVGVFGPERSGDARDTRADLAVGLRRGFASTFQLPRELVESLPACPIAAVVIDDRIAQRRIEPRNDRLVVERRGFLEIAGEREERTVDYTGEPVRVTFD